MGSSYKIIRKKINFYEVLLDFENEAERDKTFLYILRETLDQVISIDQVKGKLPRDKNFKFVTYMRDGTFLFESSDESLNAYLSDGGGQRTGSWEIGPKTGRVMRRRRAFKDKKSGKWRMVDGPTRMNRVPIRIKARDGRMIWRMAPLQIGEGKRKRWVHPGINKNNFIDRSIDLATRIFYTNPIARRKALGQVRGSSITMR
jgi:hypothetical protein